MNDLYASTRHRAFEQLARLRRTEHLGHRERAAPADVVDVRVREHEPSDRPVERVHRGGERLPLRPHHERVDHGDAVVVDHDARVAHARLAAGLQPHVHTVGDLVQRQRTMESGTNFTLSSGRRTRSRGSEEVPAVPGDVEKHRDVTRYGSMLRSVTNSTPAAVIRS